MNNLRSLSFLFLSLLASLLAMGQSSVDFSADKTTGCNALAAVQFTDLSTGNVTSWQWDFGNNNTSTLQNPVASYANPGTYTVSLTVSGPNGSLTETKNAFIQVFDGPTADFSMPLTSGCEPLLIDFEDKTTIGDAPINEYIWDFGDGSPENNQTDPDYTYQSSGSFNVSLQVIDDNGCSDVKVYSSISVVDRPQASFSSSNSPNNCSAPHTVNFANYTPGGSSLNYFWDFGDGNTSTAENPSHTYTSIGSYDVTLIAENQLCADTTTLFSFASIEPISASFNVDDNYCFGDTVFFEGVTTGASKIKWDFGDGTTSFLEEPTKVYQDSGVFVVTLTASSGPNCVATYTDSVYIKQVKAAFIVEDTFCMLPQSVEFQNTSIYGNKITWIYGSNNDHDTNLVLQLNSFKDHYVQLLIEDTIVGCESRYSEDIVVYNPIPTILHDTILKGCIPRTENFEFTYNRIYDSVSTYKWYIPELDDSSASLTFSPNFTDVGKYTVVLKTTNTRGCIAYDSVEVVAGDSLPVPLLQLQDTLCYGNEPYYFPPNVPYGDSLRYYYGFFKNAIPSVINDSSFYINTYLLDTIKYEVIDTGKWYLGHRFEYYGCPNMLLDSFYMSGPLVHTYANTSCDTMDTTNIYTLNAVIRGAYNSFKWEFTDGTLINNTTLSFTDTFPDDSTNIRFVAFNSDSTCNDTSIVEILHDIHPEVQLSANPSVCVGETALFSHPPVGSGDTLKWFINDSLIGVNIDFYQIHRDYPDQMQLKLIRTNMYGCSDTKNLIVSFSTPQADFDLSYGESCIPFPVTISNNTVSPYRKLDTMFWDFEPWGIDTTKQLEQISQQVDKEMVVSGKLIATDLIGCADTLVKDSILVAKENNLNYWVANKTVCFGDTVYFENFSAIDEPHYRWYFGDGDSATGYDAKHVYKTPGQFDVTLEYINDTLCERKMQMKNYISVQDKPTADFVADTTTASCYPLPVTYTDQSVGDDIHKWTWDFGDGVTSIFQNPFHNYTSVGKFDVSLIVETTNGCLDTVVKPEYIQLTGPTATFNIQPDSACMDQIFVFEMVDQQNVANFQWDFGDGSGSTDNPATHRYDTTGKIYPNLIISDSIGNCPWPLRDSVYIYTAKAQFDMSEDISCVGSDIQFNNLSAGATKLNWDFGDGNTSSLIDPVHSYSSAGTYTVSLAIVGENACLDTISKTVIINPMPDIRLRPDTFLCKGDTISLSASGGISYQWSPNQFLSDPNIPDPLAFPDTNMRYTVEVENQFGCMDTASINISVVNPPVENDFKDTTIIIGESIQLFSNNPGFKLDWQPPVWLSCYNCANPIAQPMKTTHYSLHTSDAFGCFSMIDSVLIEVKEAYAVSVPNAFTPNGDGHNDVIYVKGWGIKELLEFKIYNRWGELVFESSDLNHGWDGFYKNKAQDVETYVYTVKALMYNNETFQKKGNISLIR